MAATVPPHGCDMARVGDVEGLRPWIAAGGDVEERDASDMSPLGMAAMHGQIECVHALIEGGAQVDAVIRRSFHARSALGMAVGERDKKTIHGRRLCAQALLAAGADPNMNVDHPHALFLAGGQEDVGMVQMLLKAGARVDATELGGDTALLGALGRSETPASLKIIRALLGAGASPSQTGSEGLTPLMEAARLSSIRSLRLLLKAGADPATMDSRGNTALNSVFMGPLSAKQTQCCMALIGAGTPVDLPNKDRRRPLMFAAGQGNVDGALALLDAGADIDALGAPMLAPGPDIDAAATAAAHGHAELANVLGLIKAQRAAEREAKLIEAAAGTGRKPRGAAPRM